MARPWIALAAGALVIPGIVCPAWAGAAEFTVFDGRRVAAIGYDPQAAVPIRKAAALLSHDLTRLTGRTPAVGADIRDAGDGIIIGLASSPYIANLLRQNGVGTAPIAGKWETYGRAVIPAPWNARSKAQDHDYSFPNYVIDDVATIKAIALPTFPITRSDRLRIAIALDGGAPAGAGLQHRLLRRQVAAKRAG